MLSLVKYVANCVPWYDRFTLFINSNLPARSSLKKKMVLHEKSNELSSQLKQSQIVLFKTIMRLLYGTECHLHIFHLSHSILNNLFWRSRLNRVNIFKAPPRAFLGETCFSLLEMAVKNTTTSIIGAIALIYAKAPAVLPTIAFAVSVQM